MERTKLKIQRGSNHIPSLIELQKFIRGDVEQVMITKRYCFLVNDMAATNGAPINQEATRIYCSFNNTKKYIFGNALLVKTKLTCFSWMCFAYINNHLEEIQLVATIL
jgi:hypothetical protein